MPFKISLVTVVITHSRGTKNHNKESVRMMMNYLMLRKAKNKINITSNSSTTNNKCKR